MKRLIELFIKYFKAVAALIAGAAGLPWKLPNTNQFAEKFSPFVPIAF
jgi:hypothetical protein